MKRGEAHFRRYRGTTFLTHVAVMRAGEAFAHHATALYWHLVDVIWIVLYPLLYLTGRTGHG